MISAGQETQALPQGKQLVNQPPAPSWEARHIPLVGFASPKQSPVRTGDPPALPGAPGHAARSCLIILKLKVPFLFLFFKGRKKQV